MGMTSAVSRRRRRSGGWRLVTLGVVFALGVAGLAACGDDDDDADAGAATTAAAGTETTTAGATGATTGSSAASGDTTPVAAGPSDETLRTAFLADQSPPDPDVYYDTEGLQVINAVYDGLVQYKNDNSTEIVPALAEKWEISPDGLTYTFHLREATFHDGSPVTSEAVAYSFERRTIVNQGPAYTVADVASTETPDPKTFVVKLGQPVAPFMDYLASPYGVRVMNPAIIEANKKGEDGAVEYLRTHDAGTGPYTISRFDLGQVYELTRYDAYWGGPAYFAKVQIEILPEAATQQLKLEGGDLDMVHLMPATTVESFRTKDDFEVLGFPVLQRTFLQINVRLEPFDDPVFRQAFRQAVDQKTIVDRALKGIAQPSTEFYPTGMLPALKDATPYDPKPLQDALAKLPEDQRTIRLGHVIGKPDDQRMAETMQTLFQGLGIDAEVQAYTYAQLADFSEAEDTSGQPAAFVNTANPDAAHPDTWIRIFLYTEGPANVMQYSNPAADGLMDDGLHQTDPAKSVELYRQAGDLIQKDAAVINLADLTDTFIVRKGVANVTHQILPPYSVGLGQPLAISA